MINMDKYSYISKLKKTAPMKKFIFSILTLAVCLWADFVPVSILVIFIMGWSTVYKGGIPLNLFIKLMFIPMSFLVVGVLTIGINISENNDIFLVSIHAFGMNIGVSQVGLQSAVNLFFKVLGAVSCMYYLSLSTPIIDLLSVLRKLKVPKLVVEMMGLIYRFIFIILETANTMFTAQDSRLGYSSLFSGYRSLAGLVSRLFVRAYKRSDELYTALEARGYEGDLNVIEEQFEIHWSEYISLVAMNIVLILITLFFNT